MNPKRTKPTLFTDPKWIRLTERELQLIREETARTNPNLNNENGRDQATVEEHTFQGFACEFGWHKARGVSVDDWIGYRARFLGRRDDGGIDSPDGVNVKSFKSGQRHVLIKKGDDRSKKLVAMEYDLVTRRVRPFGEFTYQDAHDVVIDETTYFGIGLDEFEPVREAK